MVVLSNSAPYTSSSHASRREATAIQLLLLLLLAAAADAVPPSSRRRPLLPGLVVMEVGLAWLAGGAGRWGKAAVECTDGAKSGAVPLPLPLLLLPRMAAAVAPAREEDGGLSAKGEGAGLMGAQGEAVVVLLKRTCRRGLGRDRARRCWQGGDRGGGLLRAAAVAAAAAAAAASEAEEAAEESGGEPPG